MISHIDNVKVKDLIKSIRKKYKLGYVLKTACAYIYACTIYIEAYYYNEGTSQVVLYKEYDSIYDFTGIIIDYSMGGYTNMDDVAETIVKKINLMIDDYNNRK